MKKKNVISVLRILFYGLVFGGVLLIIISLQSFDVVAAWFNRLSGDGQFESFTLDLFQALRIPLGLVGLFVALFFGLTLFRWEQTQGYIDRFFTRSGDFGILFRQDARTFFKDIHDRLIQQKRMDVILLGGLIVAALVVRLSQFNAPLLADEAYTYNAFSSGSLWRTISDYHLPNNHVFLSVLVNILTRLLGNHVWSIRLPTMIAGMLMIPAGYILARKWYGRNAALLSAALIAVFPILVMYSVWARGYGIVSLMTLFLLILGDHVRKNKDRFAWFLMVLFSTVGFYTVPIMLFPFGAVYIWLFLSCALGNLGPYRSRLDFLKYWLSSGFASALLTLLLYAPILVNDYDRFFHNQFVAPLTWDVLPTSLVDGLRTMWLDWTSSIPGWMIIIGVAGLIASLLLHKKISREKIPLQAVFLVWMAAIIIIRRPDMNARLWLFLAAPVLIWLAGGLVGTLELLSTAFRRNFHLSQIFVGLAVISVFLAGIALIPRIPELWSRKGSIEQTVLYLKDQLKDGDIVNASTNSLSIIRYYFNVYDIPLDYVSRSGKFQRAFLAVSRETDTLETLSPVDGAKRPLINLDTARIILQFDGLTVYECYPLP